MAAAAASAKGDGYLAEGQKALNRSTFFGFGKSQKYEDAADFFTKAGNSYKLANQWQSAGEAFMKAANAVRSTDMPNDAATSFVEAANCFKKISPTEAVEAYQQAIAIYNDNGRFAMSARFYKELAELHESNRNIPEAIESYENALNLFDGDNKKQAANQCNIKIAVLSSEGGDYHKAAGIFESIGRSSMESNLGMYSAKGYLFQSLLCHLAAGDSVAVRNKIDAFKGVDHTFASSRECDLIEKLVLVSVDFCYASVNLV